MRNTVQLRTVVLTPALGRIHETEQDEDVFGGD